MTKHSIDTDTHELETAVTRPEGLYGPYAAFYDAALAAGFEEYPAGGPWGRQDPSGERDPHTGQVRHTGERYPGDRSVVLRKDDVQIWLVDRDMPRGRRETYMKGWFDNGWTAFPAPVPENPSEIDALRQVCIQCHQVAPELHHVSFAMKVCADCLPSARERHEFPGWAD